MATYGYSAGYQGGGPSAVPSGYIEAYSQAGRNIGAGMQQIGSAIGESLARYGQNKAENEFLQTRLETLAPYLNTVAQSGNIMDKNTPESKLLGDIEKFSSMSLPQKKATLLNAEFFLDRADKAKAREIQDIQTAAAQQQLAAGALQLGKAQREEAAAPYFTNALMDLYSRQPGQGPTAPYADVTQEVMDKYGGKLTQEQVQALIPLTRRMGQTLPAGLVPTGAKMTPTGIETEYGVPQTLTSVSLEGSTKLRQQLQGGKAVGAPYAVDPKVQSKIDELSEAQQTWANQIQLKLMDNKELTILNRQVKTLEEMANIPANPTGDMALIIKYMKTLDPDSQVTENEFKTLGKAGGLSTQLQNWYNGYANGNRLTPEVRREIKDASESIVSGGIKASQPTIADLVEQSKLRGVAEDLFLPTSTISRWKSIREKEQIKNLPRLQSPEEMRSKGLTEALIFNPANGKYQLWRD